jgi:hypothetical protein
MLKDYKQFYVQLSEAQSTYYVSIAQINSATLFREIIAVYSEHHINALGGQSAQFRSVMQVVRIVTTVL